MRTRYILGLLAAFAALASCEKEALRELEPESTYEQEPQVVRTVLQVGIGDTKTYLGDSEDNVRKVFWSKGNQVRANGKWSNALPEDLADKTSSVNFSFKEIITPPYKVVYPASAYTDDTHINLPAIQSYKEGGIDDNMLPLAGYSSSGSTISLSHLCAIVKISIMRASTDADTDKIATVRFRGGNEEKVSGEFEISDFETTPKLASESGSKTELEVRVNKSLETSTSKAVEYYLVVPAREYSNGFSIDVIDANGHKMTKQKTSRWAPDAGHLYKMPVFDFVPTSTELGVEIGSAKDLIDFATDYNNKVYASLGSSLVATITADITFDETTSDEFNDTGGIGLKNGVYGKEEDYYFNGVFNGNSKNYSISGLKATVPLFTATGSDGIIKNLTLDNTCSFEFTHANTTEGMFGSVVGYHKGTLDNVKVAADISLAADAASVTNMTTLGGLAGRTTVGKLQNGCEYSGLISTPAEFTSSKKVIIGGLVGRFSNAGSVTGCFFKGAISNAAQVTSTDNINPYLIIGGVVGHLDGGASVSSTNTTADHDAVASAHASLSAIIVNKTTVAYHSAVGGIVGEVVNGEVSKCTNAATIGNSIFRGADGTGWYIKSGGIVGRNGDNGVITECTNNGTVIHRSNPLLQSLGGIAGYNAGKITNCTNKASVSHMATGKSIAAGRIVSLGGVIGENYADNKVSDVHNTAEIQISSMEDGTKSEERLGGVIGYNEGIIEGGGSKDITNSGQVYHSPNFANQFIGYYIGGIVGWTKAAVKNAKNMGRTYFRWQGNTLGASGVYLGGIVGKAEGTSSTIENCDNIVDADVTNSAQVYLYLPGEAGHNGNYVGGIVGFTNATNPVKNCVNGGEVRTAAGASTVPVTGIMMGGIIGKMTGSGEVDNADNSGRVRTNYIAASDDGHSGNYLGGIIGYITSSSAVTVTGCDNSGNVDISNDKSPVQDLIVSGVVGRMDAAGTISNCNNNGGAINLAITAAAVTMKDLYIAGILGKSEQNVTISGCNNTGAVSGGNSSSAAGNSLYMGGIAAYMKGASKILNCSNTGSTVSNHSGNNDTIGSTALTGGIAGYIEGTSESSPIESGGTTGCTVNTTAALNANRGWIAGIAAYAKYAEISKCTVDNDIDAACRGAGGIVGKAEYCSISSSSFEGDKIKANQIQAGTGEGGIVGNAANSTINGCSCHATKFYNSNSKSFGGIVGISNTSNTIQNCHYKASVEGPKSGTAATGQIVGTGTFTDGGGNAADL